MNKGKGEHFKDKDENFKDKGKDISPEDERFYDSGTGVPPARNFNDSWYVHHSSGSSSSEDSISDSSESTHRELLRRKPTPSGKPANTSTSTTTSKPGTITDEIRNKIISATEHYKKRNQEMISGVMGEAHERDANAAYDAQYATPAGDKRELVMIWDSLNDIINRRLDESQQHAYEDLRTSLANMVALTYKIVEALDYSKGYIGVTMRDLMGSQKFKISDKEISLSDLLSKIVPGFLYGNKFSEKLAKVFNITLDRFRENVSAENLRELFSINDEGKIDFAKELLVDEKGNKVEIEGFDLFRKAMLDSFNDWLKKEYPKFELRDNKIYEKGTEKALDKKDMERIVKDPRLAMHLEKEFRLEQRHDLDITDSPTKPPSP